MANGNGSKLQQPITKKKSSNSKTHTHKTHTHTHKTQNTHKTQKTVLNTNTQTRTKTNIGDSRSVESFGKGNANGGWEMGNRMWAKVWLG
jgi:hypothetical protein